VNGVFETSAFLGTHVVEVNHNGMVTFDTLIFTGDETTFQVELAATSNISNVESIGAVLHQNKPNPASVNTRISFSLERGGHVTLTLYNNLGIKVKTIVNRKLVQGEYKYDLNVEDLPAGMYRYELKVDGNTDYRVLSVIH
jgi:hypothetical protein